MANVSNLQHRSRKVHLRKDMADPEDASSEKTGQELSVQSNGDLVSEPIVEVRKDSGFKAWSQVLGAFCLYFNTWGKVRPVHDSMKYAKRMPQVSLPVMAVSRPSTRQICLQRTVHSRSRR